MEEPIHEQVKDQLLREINKDLKEKFERGEIELEEPEEEIDIKDYMGIEEDD